MKTSVMGGWSDGIDPISTMHYDALKTKKEPEDFDFEIVNAKGELFKY